MHHATPPHRLSIAALLVTLLALVALPRDAGAQTPPVIDGNLTDLIQYAADLHAAGAAATIDRADPAGEVQVGDPLVIPCPTIVNNYFVNGFDLTRFVLAQAPGATTLYFGMRVVGVVGDTDGNGNPDNAGTASCNPSDNIPDGTGIGPDEFYEVQVDSKCETNFDPDGTIIVSNDQMTGTGLFAGVTGSVADGAIAYRGPGGHDLEVRVLNAALPAHFRARAFVAGIHAGLTEDFGGLTEVGTPTAAIRLTSAADSTALCEGGTTRIALTLTNTGDVPLQVTLTDELPAGMAFAGGVVSDLALAPPTITGGTIAWPDFALAAGALGHVSFEAQAGAGCAGAATNQARVSASPAGTCLSAGAASDQSALAFTCTGTPCPTGLACELAGDACLRGVDAQGGHVRSTFGGDVGPAPASAALPRSGWHHVETDGRAVSFRWSSPDARVVACADVTSGACKHSQSSLQVELAGTGTYVIGAGADLPGNMEATVVDRGSGGCDKSGDTYSIVVRTGAVVGQGEVVYQRGGEIDCGNLRARPAPPVGASDPRPDVQPVVVAALDRAAPNPFARATAFAYEVPGAGDADVAIAVYDVAGRRVRSLVAGAQATGRHTVTWDGRSDAGDVVRRGVYFVRTTIRSQAASTQRVLFLGDPR